MRLMNQLETLLPIVWGQRLIRGHLRSHGLKSDYKQFFKFRLHKSEEMSTAGFVSVQRYRLSSIEFSFICFVFLKMKQVAKNGNHQFITKMK